MPYPFDTIRDHRRRMPTNRYFDTARDARVRGLLTAIEDSAYSRLAHSIAHTPRWSEFWRPQDVRDWHERHASRCARYEYRNVI